MSSNNPNPAVLSAVELVLKEVRYLRSLGPHFRIVHRFRMPGSDCLPGEEVFAVFLVSRGREYQLQLATSQLLLFDYLSRHSRIAQSAKQIELGIRADDFYREHGANAGISPPLLRRIPRSAVREHVKRLRRALALAFHEANLRIDPRRVLQKVETVSNEVRYRLHATVHTSHLDLNSREGAPVRGCRSPLLERSGARNNGRG